MVAFFTVIIWIGIVIVAAVVAGIIERENEARRRESLRRFQTSTSDDFPKSLNRDGTYTIASWGCYYPIKLPYILESPLGGRITSVSVFVDFDYSIFGQEVTIHRARLARSGLGIGGCPINVMSKRSGEAWFSQNEVCEEWALIDAITKELRRTDSQLRRLVFGKWKGLHSGS